MATDTAANRESWWSCLLLPSGPNAGDCNIFNSDSVYLLAPTPDNEEDYESYADSTWKLRCKTFTKTGELFVAYVAKIEDPKWLVHTKRLTLTRKEFFKLPEFERCKRVRVPEYKRVTGQPVKERTGKMVYNKSLYITPIELYGVLANLEEQCYSVPKLWYFVLSSQLCRADDDRLLKDDYVHYGKLLLCNASTELNKTVSLTQSTLWVWPDSLRVAELKALFEEMGSMFAMTRTLHRRCVEMLTTFNGVITNKTCSDSIINMAFYKVITDLFPSTSSVLRANDEAIQTGSKRFREMISFYEADYEDDLYDYFQHPDSGVMLSRPVKLKNLAAYDTAKTDTALTNVKTGKERQYDVIALNASVFRPVSLMKTFDLPSLPLTNLWTNKVYSYSGKPAIDEITKTQFPVGSPFLVKIPKDGCKTMRNAYVTNVEEFDKPFLVDRVYETVNEFLDEPTIKTYVKYAGAMAAIMDRHDYCFNEKMVQGTIAYRAVLDVDITDVEFIRYYLDPENRLERKYELRQKLIDVVKRGLRIIGLGDKVEARFVVYESMGSQGKEVRKLGFRFVAVLNDYVFLSVGVVAKFAELVNLLMDQDPYFPGPCIDLNVYANGTIRLPMNCKSDKTGHLIPLVTERKKSDLVPSNGLCHLPPPKSEDRIVRVIAFIPSINESSTAKKLSDLEIIETTMENKFSKTGDVITGDYSDKIREYVIPRLVTVYEDRGFNAKTFLRVSKQSVFKQSYKLTDGKVYGICTKKHANVQGNPIQIVCDLFKKDGRIWYKVSQWCFGDKCGWSPVHTGMLGET